MASSIVELLDNLPRRSMTVRMLGALDWIVPGDYVNIVGFEESTRLITGESDPDYLRSVMKRSIELYQDPKQGYQRGLWIYRTTDSVQGLAGWTALLGKLSRDFGFLSWLSNLTPKEDTTQAVDLAIKLAAEIAAFTTLNGIPGDNIGDFVESLADYRHEARMRMGALVAVDGVLPLGPDCIDKAVDALRGQGESQLVENERFRRLRGVLPGDSTREHVGYVERGLDAVRGWVGQYISAQDITQNKVVKSVEGISEHLEGRLDYAAAFLDMTTDYFEHTGIQSVGRSLIERSMNEV